MKIKNIKKWLPVLALALTTTGCSNLDVDVKSQYTDANFPSTAADMASVCGPVYTVFKVDLGRWFWLEQTLPTDECMFATNGNNWWDNGSYVTLSLHNWATDNGQSWTVWNDLFSAISTTNQVLSILNAAPDTDQKTRAIAEVRAMRALYYFWAMDNFGALPIVTAFGQDTPQRSPRPEVAQFIESELKDCMGSLTTEVSSSTYAKPTKYMAEALLAKLYLNWAVYTTSDVSNYTPTAANSHLNDVVTLCDDIIKAGKYNLSDDWIGKFKDTNGSQIKDFIFAVPYNWSTDNTDLGGGLTHFRFWGNARMASTFNLKKTPSGPVRALSAFVDKYNLPNDVRNKIWRGGIQYNEGTTTQFYVKTTKKGYDNYYTGTDGGDTYNWPFELSKELVLRGADQSDYATRVSKSDLGDDERGKAMGWRNVKFYPSAESTTNFASNDFPIFRYADVLMMKAEAILRGATATNGETAASLVSQIRTCAGAPTVTTIDLDGLLDERAREFSDENWRRNDLIRFGKFENDWTIIDQPRSGKANFDKYRRIFPIPYAIVQQNASIGWTQNPGYAN
ncbi:RagB/SusD family nutrient uptake outer membrane protein [uncultured Bacteroides sp.]|uniref:RagB/SusD family nutrient uptake outer membrane protein n=1 Tax=uncultured Bacteroides sp. TaxID=162156 RepID=UPI002AAB63C3|nr:RagB/SusD family nutrient uptake outer membrane protein [uncultured Bacteroides sp.]